MTDPRFDDSTPLECSGCAEPAHMTAVVDGKTTPLCPDCLHDSTFVCGNCTERFWSCDGRRLYVSASLYCPKCFTAIDDAAHQTWQQRQDEHKDRMNQERR